MTSGLGFLNLCVRAPWIRMPVTSRRTRRSSTGRGTSPPGVFRSSSPDPAAPASTGAGRPASGRSPSRARAGAIRFQMSDSSTSIFMSVAIGRGPAAGGVSAGGGGKPRLGGGAQAGGGPSGGGGGGDGGRTGLGEGGAGVGSATGGPRRSAAPGDDGVPGRDRHLESDRPIRIP